MNAFFAAVEQQANPALRGRPIVICGCGNRMPHHGPLTVGNPTSRTVVAACSYEAKAFGIVNGMSVGEARQRCPGVTLVPGRPALYVAIARQIFACLAGFTPLVEIFSVDEAFLDLTGTWARFGATPEVVARRIKQQIRALTGLTCSIGLAPNKLVAKVASELQKPDGLVVVGAEEVPALMARLPIEALCGIGPRLTARLNALGVVTCRDLGEVPEPLLTEQFGILGALLKRMGQGIDESPVSVEGLAVPAKSMSHAYTLPRDTADPEVLHATLLRLSERVAHRLRDNGARGRTVTLAVRYSDFTGFSRTRTIPDWLDDGRRICELAWSLFRQTGWPVRLRAPLDHGRTGRVRLLGVSVSQLVYGSRQLSLLEEDRRWQLLNQCTDRINARFGEDSLVRAGCLAPLVTKTHGFMIHARHPDRTVIIH